MHGRLGSTRVAFALVHGKLGNVASAFAVHHPVQSVPEAWVLPEGNVAESIPHDRAAERFRQLCEAWATRTQRDVWIARNLAIRWLFERPSIGIDPDVCVLDPPPADVAALNSLCLWKPGHVPPSLSLEVVSANHPHKDYRDIPRRYAAMGARELAVFDPLLAGPVTLGGPVALQLWRRSPTGAFERVHFGDEPAYSEALGAWLHPRGHSLEVADDRAGQLLWQTGEERERAEKERERAEKERERAEKERERAEKERERAERLELEAQLEALKRQLAARPGG